MEEFISLRLTDFWRGPGDWWKGHGLDKKNFYYLTSKFETSQRSIACCYTTFSLRKTHIRRP
jgi:hypothetical protein